ncbi:hypothetical protein JW921_03050 [Candidatus Fermentibacterales bacterium]|nr:hypothetical protein [Candidatus Fermentibacterales bacterium]
MGLSTLVPILLLALLCQDGLAQPPDSVVWKLRAGFLAADASMSDRTRTRGLLGNILDMAGRDPDLLTAGRAIVSGVPALSHTPFAVVSSPEMSDEERVEELRDQLADGSREALVPLCCLLVELGRAEEARAYMEGMGSEVPATRRDLAVAAAWYGRFDVYPLVAGEMEVPADLEGDSRGLHIAAVLALGWMQPAPDGLFHGPDLLWEPVMERFAEAFEPGSRFSSGHSWVSLREVESWFEAVINNRSRAARGL